MTADQDKLLSVSSAITESAEQLTSIEARLTGLVEPASVPDLSALLSLVVQAGKDLSSCLGTGDASATGSGPALQARGIAPRGPIASRDDVRRAIEDICDYYRQQEPSSPVLILLERAQRLVEKNFMGILQDIVSDGIGASETLQEPRGDA